MSQGQGALNSQAGGGGPSQAMLPLILRGSSFSGREQHCAFLNTKGERFADVSAVSGLNLPDDGRAIARTDWDNDGDIDFWIVNRSGPSIRFMRNDVPTSNQFVSILLEGTKCNRDAIGARLELVLSDSTDGKLIKTLRAGDGFLAQSSKWVHFGIEQGSDIEKLIIRWPSGDVEAFDNIDPGSRYRIKQGTSKAYPQPRTARKLALKDSIVESPRTTDKVRVVSSSRLPLPRLEYLLTDGSSVNIQEQHKGVVLINLWASWCAPCLVELKEMTKEAAALRNTGVEVVAVSVDAVDTENTAGAENAVEILKRIQWPFAYGFASEPFIEKIELAHKQLFQQPLSLPVPTSILLDQDGRLAVIYRGPVRVEEILEDAGKLNLEGDALRNASVPFEGRWIMPSGSIRLLPYALDLVNQGYLKESIEYVDANLEQFERDVAYAPLLIRFAEEQWGRNNLEEAAIHYEKAIAHRPNLPGAYARLGSLYLAMGKNDDAKDKLATAVELNGRDVSSRMYLALLQSDSGETQNAIDNLKVVVSLMPNATRAHYELALLLDQTNIGAEAAKHYREVLRMSPDNLTARIRCAWILATHPDASVRDAAFAVECAEFVKNASSGEDIEILTTLAAAYAEAGRFEEAMTNITRAIELAKSNIRHDIVHELEKQLEFYKVNKPYRTGE